MNTVCTVCQTVYPLYNLPCFISVSSWIKYRTLLSYTVAQAERHRRNAACYARLGCFSIDPPFNNTDVLPMNPSFINTQFYLFTDFHQRTPTTISEDDLNSSHGTNFRPKLDTVIIIHGFLQNGRVDWMVHMAMEMLKRVRLQYKIKLIMPIKIYLCSNEKKTYDELPQSIFFNLISSRWEKNSKLHLVYTSNILHASTNLPIRGNNHTLNQI